MAVYIDIDLAQSFEKVRRKKLLQLLFADGAYCKLRVARCPYSLLHTNTWKVKSGPLRHTFQSEHGDFKNDNSNRSLRYTLE
jgi:hypothetical protein